MIKVSLFHGETAYGPSAVPLFGPADATFEKVASPSLLPEVVKYIETLRPVKDSIYVLVNAMGASEYYGSNVNGDAFTEESLIHAPDDWKGSPLTDQILAKDWPYGYPTFYNAHPYAHHRNKDSSRAFGCVEFSGWNPQMKRVELVTRVDKDKCLQYGGVGVWDKLHQGQFPDVSMGTKVPFDTCFPAGTLVRTGDGQKPIEEIRVGDFVLSHTGAYREVRQTMRREAEGLVRITASGLPRIGATDNHPFLVLRREQARTCKGSANGSRLRHSFSDGPTCKRCGRTPEFELVWAAAETLKPGDYLATPLPEKTVAHDVAPAQARLLGYYLGDGYIIQQRTGKKKDGDYRDMGFGFSVGSTETEHLRRLLHTVVEAGAPNEPNVYDAGCDRKAYIVSAYDQSLAAWLQKWGGRTSHGKRLIEETFYWSREAKLELVAGYIDTDGSFDEKGQIRIASVNRGLLLDVQRLLLSEGITATVCFAGTNTSGFGSGSDSWYLVLSAAQGQKFLGRSTKIKAVDVSWESPQSFFWGGYWLTPVKAVEELDGDVEVFNLSVDKDESYVAEGRAVHNCSICLDWDLYRKAQQTFDPKHQKSQGEAVLAFHKKLALRNGHGIRGVSITRKDYCDHSRKQMNKILPDGRKVFVFNDYPRFFDISFVFIGADRTAKVMLKIAGDSKKLWSFGSAELAEKLGYQNEFSPGEPESFSKVASIADEEEQIKAAFLGKAAKDKRGVITKDVVPSQFASKAVPVLTKSEGNIPKDLLNVLGAAPLEEALSTPSALGIVLRPREFQRIMLIQIGRHDLADKYDKDGTIFPKASEHEHVPMGPGHVSPVLARLLISLIGGRSGFGPAIEKRATLISEKPSEEHVRPSSLSSPLLRKMGAAYTAYRQNVMDLVAHSQEVLSSEGMPSDGYKLAYVPVDALFTPLSVEYFGNAFMDEVGTSETEKTSGVERGSPSRNTSDSQLKAGGQQ